MGKPFRQFRKSKLLLEILHGLNIQIHIGHLHRNLLQVILQGKNIRIAHGLCLMHVNRLFQMVQILIDSLNLINHNQSVIVGKNTIGTTINSQLIQVILYYIF